MNLEELAPAPWRTEPLLGGKVTIFDGSERAIIKEEEHADLFEGKKTKRKERKSFFRRLHEAKMPEGDPRRIDHEDVILARRVP
jgi:hypothetical protein